MGSHSGKLYNVSDLKHSLNIFIQNAFSKLAEYGFNFFAMFVPDLLHEVELGGWKDLFTHLLRLVDAVDPAGNLAKLNERQVVQILLSRSSS